MYKKKIRKLLSFLLTLALLVPLCQEIMPERVAQAATVLENPRMDSGGVVTWDCVWFGNYWQEDINGDGEADKDDEEELINALFLGSGAKADVKDQGTLKECYIDILTKRDCSGYYFALGDLNEDLIPELMISSTDKCLDIVHYYTYQDGQAVEVQGMSEAEGYNNYGDLYSMPGRGTYAYYYQAPAFDTGGSGIVIPRVIQEYKLVNNKISLVKTLTWDEFMADTVTNEYRLNGSLCTADEFQAVYKALGKRFEFVSNTEANRKKYIAVGEIPDDSESETTPAPTQTPAAGLLNGNNSGTSVNGSSLTDNEEVGKATIKSVKNAKGRKIKITLKKKVKGAVGYQIQYAMNKKFTKAKKSKDVNKWTLAETITGLKKGKTYFIRVQAYLLVGTKKVCGAWSSVKKIKIQK